MIDRVSFGTNHVGASRLDNESKMQQDIGVTFLMCFVICSNLTCCEFGCKLSGMAESSVQKGDSAETKESWFQKKKKEIFRKKTLYKRLPILRWLPQYKVQDIAADLIAGITVGITVIPQGLAYATVAALPPQYGLYSAYMGCFVYLLLGSTQAVTIGPTALMSLATYDASMKLGVDGAVILAFMTGVIVLLLGLFNLGFLIDFISEPVISGFSSAAALNIITTQIEALLGLNFDAEGTLDTWISVFEHIDETRTWDAVMGFATIAALLLIRLLEFVQFGEEGKRTSKQQILQEICRIVSASRNAIVIIIATLIAANLTTEDYAPFQITGNITAGLPPFKSPPFSFEYNNESYNFFEVCSTLGASLFVAPLVSIIESVAIAKSVAKGQRVDVSQEMISIGTSNLLGSFVLSYPVTGSFSRTAVNAASGVHTPLSGIYTGVLVLLAITVLTPYFYYIPKSCLAGVIICAVVFMIEVTVLKHVWRSRKLDIIPLLVSFFCCLFLGLSQGIVIGALVNLSMLLYSTARPRIFINVLNAEGVDYVFIRPDRSIVFPAMDYFTSAVRKACMLHQGVPIVIDLSAVTQADFSTAYGFDHLTRNIHKRSGHPVIVTAASPHVIKVLTGIKTDFYVHQESTSWAYALQDVMSSTDPFKDDVLSIIDDASENARVSINTEEGSALP